MLFFNENSRNVFFSCHLFSHRNSIRIFKEIRGMCTFLEIHVFFDLRPCSVLITVRLIDKFNMLITRLKFTTPELNATSAMNAVDCCLLIVIVWVIVNSSSHCFHFPNRALLLLRLLPQHRQRHSMLCFCVSEENVYLFSS